MVLRRGLSLDPELFEYVKEKLPDFFTRSQVEECTKGLIRAKYLTGLDNKGRGPKQRNFGDRVVYKKSEFLEWMDSYYGNNNGAGGEVCGSSEPETGA